MDSLNRVIVASAGTGSPIGTLSSTCDRGTLIIKSMYKMYNIGYGALNKEPLTRDNSKMDMSEFDTTHKSKLPLKPNCIIQR